MSFDFFNPSNLAFGSKLTAAFTQLNSLADAGDENLEKVREIQEHIEQYNKRNYIVPKPTKPASPCRTNEMFDVLNDVSVIINEISYKSNTLKVDLNLFDKTNNRTTKATGTTKIKKGYCYIKSATSNQKPNKEISFSEEAVLNLGKLLFQYEINSTGTIILIGDIGGISCFPSDGNIYSSLSKGSSLPFSGGVYKAKEYECVCLIGHKNDIQVKLNGRVILQGYGDEMKRHCILYLKPDDEVSGSIASGFKINYNV